MTDSLEDFDPGEDVTDQFVIQRKPGMVVSVRLDAQDSQKLLTYADETGYTVSQIARQAIHSFFSSTRRSGGEAIIMTVAAADPAFGFVIRTTAEGTPTAGTPLAAIDSRGPTPAVFQPV